MMKHKKVVFCLILLLISIILIFTLSIKTGSVSNKVDDLKQQVGIRN